MSPDAATPTPPPPSASPNPSPTADPAAQHFIDAAKAYATKAGFNMSPSGTPEFAIDNAGYSGDVLPRVFLPLVSTTDGSASLHVFFDSDGAIAAVENQGPSIGNGQPIGKANVLKAAQAQLDLAGVAIAAAKPVIQSVTNGGATIEWGVTYQRTVHGYPVANWPQGWGLNGDKAYVLLDPDGSLHELYAIQHEAGTVPTLLGTAKLNAALAKAAGVSTAKLATYNPRFEWVRVVTDGATKPGLALGYCERHAWSSGWQSFCVDAGTGEVIANEGGVD